MKKKQMRLEPLGGSKFEALTHNAMSFIVGGGGATTGSTSGATGRCYSNDFTDSTGTWCNPGGGDFSAETLKGLVAGSTKS